MQSRINVAAKSIVASMLVICVSGNVQADSIGDAIASQAAVERAQATQMASIQSTMRKGDKPHAANTSDDVPTLFSVMAMGSQCVLKFVTLNGKYVVTESSPNIGGAWKLVKADGLSAIIQNGSKQPIRVYLSIPDDVQDLPKESSAAPGLSSVNTTMPPIPTQIPGMPASMQGMQ